MIHGGFSKMLKTRYPSGPVIVVTKPIDYAVPFGPLYIAGYLREKREAVEVLFWPEQPSSYREFVRLLKSKQPLVVGFSGLYPDLYVVRELVKLIEQEGCDFSIAVGGQMVSPTPKFSVELTGADYGVVGEGELIFHELVTALREGRETSGIKGLVIRDGSQVLLTGAGPYFTDLAKLSPIAYDMIPSQKWLNLGRYYIQFPQPHWHYNDRVLSIHGGRGCPQSCNFCYHHSQARYRPIPLMLEEARSNVSRYNVNMLFFSDDLVLPSLARTRELTAEFRKFDRPLAYAATTRFDTLSRIDDDLLREMKATGCRSLGLGIESGSQRILDVMHKRITIEQVRTGLRRLHAAGILPSVGVMVGQVSETNDDARLSLELMRDCVRDNPNVNFSFSITTPFPGSEIYTIAFQKGLLNSDREFYDRFEPVRSMSGVTVNLSAMKDGEVLAWRNRMMQVYIEEKHRGLGRLVLSTERLRRILAFRVDRRLRPKLVEQHKLGRLGARLYEHVYNSCQAGLDRLRLRLYGCNRPSSKRRNNSVKCDNNSVPSTKSDHDKGKDGA
jgi:radical SAM superfamily enzyme YgiQ (UPF0313 family)